MSTHVDMKDFVAGFLLEAAENLHAINRNLVAVNEAAKKALPEPRAVRDLFRALHTIKGLASMVGAEPVVDISHEMEGILREADRAGGRISEQSLDLIIQGTRAIEERVHAISKDGIGKISPAPTQLIESLVLAQNAHNQPKAGPVVEFSLPPDILRNLSPSDREQMVQGNLAGRRVVLVEFQPSAEKMARGLNITAVRERLAKLGELIKVVPRSSAEAPTGITFCLILATESADVALAEAAGASVAQVNQVIQRPSPAAETSISETSTEWTPSDQSSIRVNVGKLDEALERLSALVVTRSKMARVASEMSARGVDTRELNAVIAENTRQLRRLRAAITEARMVPLAELLQRIPLVVRGLTKDSNKSVNVMIQAGTAEVDKAVADKIFPAVVHLVRNAVDHAIESREQRILLKKPEQGSLTILCDNSSGTSLVLTISDDGRGIDRQAVARKASRPIASSDEELLQQIASPGLSTREDVTHTSGRGMGMEIVKRTVEVLGGALALKTVEGKGTTFTLRVPVSITIVDVLSFKSGGQVYVVPVAMIDEIIEVDPSRMVKSPMPLRRGPETLLLQRRGTSIPYFSLNALLQKREEDALPSKALVVNQNRGAIAFGVESMLGQQEVVVRPLDDLLTRVTGMAGATDLGDGHPTLVLDLAALGAAVMQDSAMGAK